MTHYCKVLCTRCVYSAVGHDWDLSTCNLYALYVPSRLHVSGHALSPGENAVDVFCHDNESSAVQRVVEANVPLYGMLRSDRTPIGVPHVEEGHVL